MRHFAHLSENQLSTLFFRVPQPLSADDGAQRVGFGLGAALYMPGTRPHLADDIIKQMAAGLVTTVLCLEDAISEDDVEGAQANIVDQLVTLAEGSPTAYDVVENLPFVFIRVRTPQQIVEIVNSLEERHPGGTRVLAGFVMPKFTTRNADAYLDALGQANRRSGRHLLCMPVIEVPEVVYRETRSDFLSAVAEALESWKDSVACIRIGGTDLCSTLGLRRPRELTIYEVGTVASVLYDIVNVFGRVSGTGYPISGPVWEYFSRSRRLFKPQLRSTPFSQAHHEEVRQALLDAGLDGLVRELVLDRANGLTGKTVIHPQHVGIVHALSVVTREEYGDAQDVIAQHANGGGVTASGFRNKMNEAGPHLAWAQRTMMRAEAFGVTREGVGMVDLLLAHEEATGHLPVAEAAR